MRAGYIIYGYYEKKTKKNVEVSLAAFAKKTAFWFPDHGRHCSIFLIRVFLDTNSECSADTYVSAYADA